MSCTVRGGFLHLEVSLKPWLILRDSCCARMTFMSEIGSCSWVNWFLWVHYSRDDNPFRRSLELNLAVATASVSSDIGDSPYSSRSNSFSNSAIAFSATGFSFGFFTRPTSTETRGLGPPELQRLGHLMVSNAPIRVWVHPLGFRVSRPV
jgi:hypothetical protein